jgi:hypothetical protein
MELSLAERRPSSAFDTTFNEQLMCLVTVAITALLFSKHRQVAVIFHL